MTRTGLPRASRYLGFVAACVLLAAFLLACAGEDPDAASSEKILEVEAKVHSLQESLEALTEENAKLSRELAALRQEQGDYIQAQEAAKATKEQAEEEEADFKPAQEERLASLEKEQASNKERLTALEDQGKLASDATIASHKLEARLKELETAAAAIEGLVALAESAFTDLDKRLSRLEGTSVERTARLAEEAGGEVYYIDHPEREERAILVMPLEPIDGNPLIVSLHGFGGNSADHARYVPLHERVIADGFGLLLPNGIKDAAGLRFWNPTDGFGKARQNDFAYLTELVARAKEVKDFGPVYFFGYSNGGFMSYWMACQGLPDLRAIASLAGTSYMDDDVCEGAAPVSVLHIHGEQDRVVRFRGSEESLEPVGIYAGAGDMYHRWGERAGCDTNSQKQGQNLDLDASIEGEETFTYRFTEGCAEGINVELWSSGEGGHSPAYGDAFTDALLDWLLAQK